MTSAANNPWAWTDDAACAGTDPAIWYPEVTPPYSAALMALPRTICGGCPVRAECMDRALRLETDGIWAATDPITRRRMRRSMAIPDPPPVGA